MWNVVKYEFDASKSFASLERFFEWFSNKEACSVLYN